MNNATGNNIPSNLFEQKKIYFFYLRSNLILQCTYTPVECLCMPLKRVKSIVIAPLPKCPVNRRIRGI